MAKIVTEKKIASENEPVYDAATMKKKKFHI
jgi:hypothetical protein